MAAGGAEAAGGGGGGGGEVRELGEGDKARVWGEGRRAASIEICGLG
jgi:hypothetical protein